MPTTDWQFLLNGTTNFNSYVLSASIKQGREKYLDFYAGGSISITINNNTNYSSNFVFNTTILLENGTGVNRSFRQKFVVQEITFDDYPGNTGLSTATIFAVDPLARAGRIQATNVALAQNNTINQLETFNGNPLPSDLNINALYGGGESIASAQTYTGTVLNQINISNATERGLVVTAVGVVAPFDSSIRLFERVNPYITPASFSFGRSTSASVIAYRSFERYQNGLSFVNTATISPLGLSSETRTNSSSVTAYGATFFSSTTVDYNATQAQGNGDWIVNSFSDPASLRFELEFTDKMQNDTAFALFNNYFFTADSLLYEVDYLVPGDSSESAVQLVREGWQININPSETTYRLFFSPLTYYSFFTLDSATLGLLGGGNITYEQPEITYDETGWVYNDSNADDTASRLGW